MNTLAACNEPFRYVNTDIKYSYVSLRRDGKTRTHCHIPKDTKALRLSNSTLNVGKRITVVAAKMSEDLGDKETHLFRLCDGSAEKTGICGAARISHNAVQQGTRVCAIRGGAEDPERACAV